MLAVRPRGRASNGLAMRHHELLGWVALATAALHVGLLLTADHRVVEHLKPTAPAYEFAGICALLALLFLTVPAGTRVRPRLWSSHRNFQAAHVVAACLLIVTVAAHIVTTDRYVHGRAQRAAYILLSSAVLLGLLRARATWQPRQRHTSFLAGLVFGRHSRLVLAIVVCSLAALLVLTRAGATLVLREPFVRRSERLALDFPHDRHRAVSCILCHHNFVDQTGAESCVSCHRSSRADLRVGAEARFHDFCLGCHRDPPPHLTGHGPVSGCSTCHAALTFGGH